MKQFYEAYKDSQILSPPVRQLPWFHRLIILGQSKRPEEREFLPPHGRSGALDKPPARTSVQIRAPGAGSAECAKSLTSGETDSAGALTIFRDSYALEFLGLPPGHSEADLHRGLLARMKDFLLELGRDFCFAGSEYPLQVGQPMSAAASG
jgi:YhcG PDDEXK nuclease domain/DUF1016 N-terminal domain